MALSSEEAYLFVHIALREAAYQLWLPSDRAALHERALAILEGMGGDLDRLALELAEHAHQAQQGAEPQRNAALLRQLREKELEHLRRARKDADKRYQRDRVVETSTRMLNSPLIAADEAAEVEQLLAEQLMQSGQIAQATERFSHALSVANGLGLGRVSSQCLVGQGRIAAAQGKKAEAERLLDEAIQVAEKAGEGAVQGNALSWLAGFYEDTGRGHLCEEMHRRAVALAASAGNESIRLSALGNLANHYRHTGRLDDSVKTMQEVYEGFLRFENVRSIGTALNNMGRTLFMLGRLDEAESAYLRAIAIFEPTGQAFSIAFALGNVSEIWLARGRLAEAASALERAIAICDETASHMHGAAFKARLAALRLLLGQRELAQETVEDSRTDFIHSGGEQYIADYCDIVRLRVAADAATSAEALLQRKTAKVHALAPRAAWLPVMKQILGGMKKSLAAQKAGSLELKLHVDEGEALLAEIESAVRENRAALVFRGSRPQELSRELRTALLQDMEAGELEMLRKLNPELHAALAK